MKTPLQTAIERLKENKLKLLSNNFKTTDWHNERCEEIDTCISLLESLLRMEREVICQFAVKYMNADDIDSNSLFSQTFKR